MPTLKRYGRRPHLYRRSTLLALAAVVGPGVLAGLSDDASRPRVKLPQVSIAPTAE